MTMAAKITAYLLLLHLLHTLVCTRGEDCPDLQPPDLTCLNDYNRTITCFWNSTRGDSDCTIFADKLTAKDYNSCSGSCKFEPMDPARPQQKKCSVVFSKMLRFQTNQIWTIALNCSNIKPLCFKYVPSDHVKMNPPPKPSVNLTAVSWSCQAQKNTRIPDCHAELQWKEKDQPWSSRPQTSKTCLLKCSAQLPDDVILGAWYEARVRVKPDKYGFHSLWSEWSPTVSWKAHVGKVRSIQTPPEDAWGGLSAFVCTLGGCLVILVVLIRVDKTRWIYIVKRIRGPPLPNPEKSFLHRANFQNLVSPHLSGESYYFKSKQVDVVPVEVASPPSGQYAASQEKTKRSHESYESSNFSNPSYSRACSPPVILLSSSNLDACDTDAPYGPVGPPAGGDGDPTGTNVELQQLLFPVTGTTVPVVLEYEKVQSQAQCSGSQRQDVPSCSGEESRARVGLSDGAGEPQGGTVEKDRIDFQKLFGRTRILNEGSILVSSGYEQVQKLQADNNELPSLDSGVSSGVEDQTSQEDSLEDTDSESNHLLFSPPPFPCTSLVASQLRLPTGEPAAPGFF